MKALLQHPAFWLALTVGTYLLADWLFHRSRRFPLLHPVFVAAMLLIGLLKLTGTSYAQYMSSAYIIHLLLGPATVSLAIPLYTNLARVRELLLPLMIALVIGGLTAIGSVIAFGYLFGLTPEVLVSFAPKSVTTPIAMALADRLGGNASIAAAAVMVTGVFGAMIAETLLRVLRIHDDAVKGFAIGITSHGTGTARAFQISPTAGAFSGLGMGLNGVLTSLCLPLIFTLWPV